MSDFFKELYLNYKKGNLALKFIYLSVFIEFIITLLEVFFFRDNKGYLYTLFGLNSEFYSFLTFPFSLFTYIFINNQLFSFIFNLLSLYYISNLFLTYFRENNLITFSILGIIGSGLFFIFISFFFQNNLILVGPKPLLFCLLFAIIAYRPRFPLKIMFVTFPLELKYIGYFFLFLELVNWLGNSQDYTYFVSFASAAMGFFYMKQFEVGNDFIGNYIEKFIPKKRKSSNTLFNNPPKDDIKFNNRKANKQALLNSILDKISAKGYDSLSKEEKEFLFKKSKE